MAIQLVCRTNARRLRRRPALARQTRHKFYGMATSEKMLVAGCHFAFPSAVHVEKDGAGYRLVPMAWSAAI